MTPVLPERTAQSYGPGITAASKRVLLELLTILRSYREALVLVGGWAPYFLLEQHRRPDDRFVHVGSIDIDLAVDTAKVREPEYATMVELLTARGYVPATTRRGGVLPTSLERRVRSPVTQKLYTIRVDFLTRGDWPSGMRQVPVQDDLMARKMKGCEAAFTHQTDFPLSGELPEGGAITVPVRMADLVACVTMKGIVLGERYREKDAYDLYALLAHYGRGPQEVAEMLRPYRDEPLLRDSLASIRAAFGARDANGPAWAAAFLVSPLFGEEYQRLVTDAFMVVREVTDGLDSPETERV